jgi:hypothetical protein
VKTSRSIGASRTPCPILGAQERIDCSVDPCREASAIAVAEVAVGPARSSVCQAIQKRFDFARLLLVAQSRAKGMKAVRHIS